MNIINLISLGILINLLVYLIVFLVRYKQIPQSLSVTAEYPDQYYYWQVVICLTMGWMSYYYPVIYFQEYGLLTLLASAGVSGLGLAGYFSYSPYEETPRDLKIHKIGSFSGACLLMLFYFIISGFLVLIPLILGVILGLVIPGNRYNSSRSNSVVFWTEIGVVVVVGYDIVSRFITMITS